MAMEDIVLFTFIITIMVATVLGFVLMFTNKSNS